MKPSRPRRFNSARSAARRGALAPRSVRSSNDWNRASGMIGSLVFSPLKGEGGGAPEHQSGPALERDAPLEGEMRIGGARGGGLGVQEAGEDEAPARRHDPGQRRREPLQRRQQDIGEDDIERRASANVRR